MTTPFFLLFLLFQLFDRRVFSPFFVRARSHGLYTLPLLLVVVVVDVVDVNTRGLCVHTQNKYRRMYTAERERPEL